MRSVHFYLSVNWFVRSKNNLTPLINYFALPPQKKNPIQWGCQNIYWSFLRLDQNFTVVSPSCLWQFMGQSVAVPPFCVITLIQKQNMGQHLTDSISVLCVRTTAVTSVHYILYRNQSGFQFPLVIFFPGSRMPMNDLVSLRWHEFCPWWSTSKDHVEKARRQCSQRFVTVIIYTLIISIDVAPMAWAQRRPLTDKPILPYVQQLFSRFGLHDSCWLGKCGKYVTLSIILWSKQTLVKRIKIIKSWYSSFSDGA